MKSDQERVKKASKKLAKDVSEEHSSHMKKAMDRLGKGSIEPQDLFGLSDDMIEGIYGQAYRLYNTGKFKEASHLFRLLAMLKSTESKYILGLAACQHMLKQFQIAAETYTVCGMFDPDNPIPHYHTSDCCIQLGDAASAVVALEMCVERCGKKPEYKIMKDRSLLTIKSLKKELKKTKKKK